MLSRTIAPLLMWLALPWLCATAHAEDVVVVRYYCEPAMQRIRLTYGFEADDGQSPFPRGPNAWSPWRPVKGKDFWKVNLRCRLRDGDYRIEIRAVLANSNPQGACGVEMQTDVTISLGRRTIARSILDGECFGRTRTVTEVMVKSGARKAEFATVCSHDFYGWYDDDRRGCEPGK